MFKRKHPEVGDGNQYHLRDRAFHDVGRRRPDLDERTANADDLPCLDARSEHEHSYLDEDDHCRCNDDSRTRVVSQPGDNVHLGDTGSGVKQIQAALVAHGYKVSADGTFGLQTAQAVKDFQTKNGLAADGVVGRVTWAKLSGVSVATTTASTTPKATTTTAKH